LQLKIASRRAERNRWPVFTNDQSSFCPGARGWLSPALQNVVMQQTLTGGPAVWLRPPGFCQAAPKYTYSVCIQLYIFNYNKV
jgi:hypothetical protein